MAKSSVTEELGLERAWKPEDGQGVELVSFGPHFHQEERVHKKGWNFTLLRIKVIPRV